MIEPGLYVGTPRLVGASESSKKTPYIYCEYDIKDQGVSRTVYFYLSDAAWDSSEQKLKTVGFNGNFENPDFAPRATDLVCKHEEYQGKVREKWELASWGDEKPTVNAKVIQRLNAKWKRSAGVTVVVDDKPEEKPTEENKDDASYSENIPF